MYVLHLALGGCLKVPPVRYGVTEDTGGHIAYVLGAATAQAADPRVTAVDVITRRFNAPHLGSCHAVPVERLSPNARIWRIDTGDDRYLIKDDLERDAGDFTRALLRKLAEQQRHPDIIHAHFPEAVKIASSIRARYGSPIVYSAHSLAYDKAADLGLPANSPDLARRLDYENAAIASADAILASSQDEAVRQLPRYAGCDPTRVHLVEPGIDQVHPRAVAAHLEAARSLIDPLLENPAKPLLLAVARPVARKNLEGLLELVAQSSVLRERVNVAIVAGHHPSLLADGGEAADIIMGLRERVRRFRLERTVALPETHERRHVFGLYALAAARGGVFVNPAFSEPFGLTIAEAAAHGLPCVATCRGGPPETLRALGCGLAADPLEPAAFADAIRAIIENSDLWYRFSRTGARRASARTWSAWAAAVTPLNQKLIAVARAQGAAALRTSRSA